MADTDFTIELIKSNGQRVPGPKIGKTMRRLIDNLRNVPKKAFDQAPKTFKANVANRVRFSWRENYLNKFLWSQTAPSGNYAVLKNRMFERGDTFKIGSLGVAKIGFSGGTFGRRTDTIFRTLGSARGSEVSQRVFEKSTPQLSSRELEVRIRVKDELWESGGQDKQFIGGDNSKAISLTTRNQLRAFSHQVTPSALDLSSVFVVLNRQQISNLVSFMIKSFSKRAKEVIVTEVVKFK